MKFKKVWKDVEVVDGDKSVLKRLVNMSPKEKRELSSHYIKW